MVAIVSNGLYVCAAKLASQPKSLAVWTRALDTALWHKFIGIKWSWEADYLFAEKRFSLDVPQPFVIVYYPLISKRILWMFSSQTFITANELIKRNAVSKHGKPHSKREHLESDASFWPHWCHKNRFKVEKEKEVVWNIEKIKILAGLWWIEGVLKVISWSECEFGSVSCRSSRG